MTIETANRLVELRKKNNLSQEELAEKLGVSRQAISKWERSEASPDTDNLIALAEIYGMSLDELIFGEKRGGADEEEKKDESEVHVDVDGKKTVTIGPAGIFVKSKDGDEVNISLKGINIKANDLDDDDLDVEFDDEDEEHGINGRIEVDMSRLSGNAWLDLPYPIICAVAYLVFGFCNIWGGWALSWIIFITIPIYYELIDAITKRRFSKFSFSIPAAFLFLYIGLYHGIWHPTWLIFFAIPILDSMMAAIDKSIARRKIAKKTAENIEIQ